MHRITTLRCLCGAQLDEIDTDTDTGIAIVCRECGSAEAWPEHITDRRTATLDIAEVSRGRVHHIIDPDRTES